MLKHSFPTLSLGFHMGKLIEIPDLMLNVIILRLKLRHYIPIENDFDQALRSQRGLDIMLLNAIDKTSRLFPSYYPEFLGL